MGILDIFGGGSGPAKAQKLKNKATQKFGDPLTRQRALEQLGEMKIPEAVSALLYRFTISVDPQTTDADEKERVVQLIKGMGPDAVAPVRNFLETSEQSTSWALRVLEELVGGEETNRIVVDLLDKLGSGYSRTPDKKVVLLQHVEDKSDPRIAEVSLPMLEDHSDDVKLAALKVLGTRNYEPAREKILEVLTHEETGRRVQAAAISALHESGFGVQGYREKVEARLAEPWYLDKAGVVKKRT